ncbi:MAG TPA: tetratricopeptide repeat protein [Candidatus Polarisedimenticolaceae bacterium]|nr:tetratricopeptide repeat protein [Candidatus Polarisedimenticolaceae bacterium]
MALGLLGAGDVAAQGAPDPVALFNAGKFAEAAQALETLSQSNPDDPGVHYLLGRSYLKLERNADAVRELQKAVDLKTAAAAQDPQADPKTLFDFEFWLANAYVAAKDWPKVVEVLQKAEPRIPDDTYRAAALGMRGYAHLMLEHYPEAARDLEANLALNRKSAASLVALGKAYYGMKEFEKSAAVFREASALEPNESGTLLLLGNAELAAGVAGQGAVEEHLNQAMTAADRYLTAKNNDPAGLQLKAKATQARGRFYIEQKKWAEAEQALAAASQMDPKNGSTYEALGFVYLSQDKLQQALEAYQKANQLASTASAQEGIKAVQDRMEMQAANAQAGADKAAWEAKRKQHEKEYQEYLKKREEWEKKRNDGN